MVGALKSIAFPNLAVVSILPCSCASKVNKRIIVGAAIWNPNCGMSLSMYVRRKFSRHKALASSEIAK